jgi:hypothetical protein
VTGGFLRWLQPQEVSQLIKGLHSRFEDLATMRIAVVGIVTHSGLTVSSREMLVEFCIVYGEEEKQCCLVSDKTVICSFYCFVLT